MTHKEPIEKQVAQLSQRQQDKILKVGKIALTFQLVGGIPMMILVFLGLWTMIDPPLGFDYTNYGKLFLGQMILLVLTAAYMLGILLLVKIKCPYYSDARWRYIHKIRKGK